MKKIDIFYRHIEKLTDNGTVVSDPITSTYPPPCGSCLPIIERETLAPTLKTDRAFRSRSGEIFRHAYARYKRLRRWHLKILISVPFRLREEGTGSPFHSSIVLSSADFV
ncbi:hypothetical protein TNCV_2256071, partial [Trichonephila clavipes]